MELSKEALLKGDAINIFPEGKRNKTNDILLPFKYGAVSLAKKTKDVIKDSKLFEDNNLELPFMLDITNKLNYYGLIKSNINNIDELVDELWK